MWGKYSTISRKNIVCNNSREIKDFTKTVIDSTSGTAMYLFLDMHGDNDRAVRVIFDTGASISLWLATAVQDGRLRAYLDHDNPTTITGIGKGRTQAQTATVIIPGNIKSQDGGYPVYLSKSTIVNEIIAPDRKSVV